MNSSETVDLILTNGTNQYGMNCDKNILSSSAPYFKSLFSNFKEKDADVVTITVPNIPVSYDIIMEFYNQRTNLGNFPEYAHLLESVKCKIFLEWL
jgi:BTB/POZ domain